MVCDESVKSVLKHIAKKKACREKYSEDDINAEMSKAKERSIALKKASDERRHAAKRPKVVTDLVLQTPHERTVLPGREEQLAGLLQSLQVIGSVLQSLHYSTLRR